MKRAGRWLPVGMVAIYVAVAISLYAVYYGQTVQFTTRSGTTYFLASNGGQLRFVRQAVSPAASASLVPDTSMLDAQNVGGQEGFQTTGLPSLFGFQWVHYLSGWFQLPQGGGRIGTPNSNSIFVFDYLTLGFPAWILIIPPLLFVVVRIWHTARHRIIPGKCPICGYDLRATPDRCPECGMVPTPIQNAPAKPV